MAKRSQAVEGSSEQGKVNRSMAGGDNSAESWLVGDDPGFQGVHRYIQESGASTASVLITGERGTGKTLVARALHANSPRSREPFVTIHCSIFTDPASKTTLGKEGVGTEENGIDWLPRHIQSAEGGTLLLEEVGLLPLGVQAQLVNLLAPTEASNAVSDIRIVSTSSGNLTDLVSTQLFQKSLLDRLSAESIHLPTLRDVPENLQALSSLFFDQMGRAMGRQEPLSFTIKAMTHVRQYPWPGNVEELRQEIERLVTTFPKNMFTIQDLSDCIHYYKEPIVSGPPMVEADIFQPYSFVMPII